MGFLPVCYAISISRRLTSRLKAFSRATSCADASVHCVAQVGNRSTTAWANQWYGTPALKNWQPAGYAIWSSASAQADARHPLGAPRRDVSRRPKPHGKVAGLS
jgi:hypothetical protein